LKFQYLLKIDADGLIANPNGIYNFLGLAIEYEKLKRRTRKADLKWATI